MKIKVLVLLMSAGFIFLGCSDNDAQISNKSANYWYQRIVHNIAVSNLSQADDFYNSLHSEHVSSPLLPDVLLMLSHAHARFDELLLSQYYLEAYLKRFGNTQEREYVEFLKVKAAFLGYHHPNRDQKFLDETIDKIAKFEAKFPQSVYLSLVKQMLLRLELGRDGLKEEIVALYKRVEKPKAAEYYKNKDRLTGIDPDAIIPAERSWMRKLFE
ncbi:MAG: outer membrane protein assembly factor BamD [Thiovulaceae bacterium]|nr:outer membrane protein assembly factor BamD [Sulfurimonadaceae bacterium]